MTEQKLEILRQADAIYLEEIRAAGLYDAILAQAGLALQQRRARRLFRR